MNPYTKQAIDQHKDKQLFLLDSSAFIRFEEIYSVSDLSLLGELHESSAIHYFLTNNVWVELMNGPRQISAEFIKAHIINDSVSMVKDWKENKFVVERDGQLGYIELNKISAVDYGQIVTCQNHPELTLVANDRKMLKSAKQILGSRVIGTPTFLDLMIDLHPQNKKLTEINKAVKRLFELIKV